MPTVPSEPLPVWVAGADGYRDGWIVVLWRPATGTVRRRIVDGVDALLDLPEVPAVLGVDMGIGVPDEAKPGGRRCDRCARQLLGPPRGSSVFSSPAYAPLGAETYEAANRRNRASGLDAPGLSKQSFFLKPKMKALAERCPPRSETAPRNNRELRMEIWR